MGKRKFEDWIEAATYGTEGMSSPEIFRRWAALSCIGGALGRKAYYDHGDYKVRPNLLIILVGPPSCGKTLICDYLHTKGGPFAKCAMTPLLKKGEEDKLPAHKLEWRRYMKGSSPLIHFLGYTTPRELVNMLSEVEHAAPPGARYGDMEEDSSVTIYTPEFGQAVKRTDDDFFYIMTQGWETREEHEHRTSTCGKVRIDGLSINWLACATPEQFVERLPASISEQGLLSRLLPIWHPAIAEKPVLKAPEFRGWDMAHDLATDLGRIAALHGPFDFTPDGAALAQQWLDEGQPPVITEPLMKEYTGRRLGHLLKMCICVSAARRDSREITADDWRTASSMLFEAEARMPMVLRRFGMSDAGRWLDRIETAILEADAPVRRSAIHREAARYCKAPQDVKPAMDMLLGLGRIRAVTHEGEACYARQDSLP